MRSNRSCRTIAPALVKLAFACIVTIAAASDDAGPYTFNDAAVESVALYRQGWREILEYGRWTKAEQLYREALQLDSRFTIALSVLGRITLDASERDSLYKTAETQALHMDTDGRLLLRTYQKTLELFALRERGEAVPKDFRAVMAQQAIDDYGQFLEKYPDEWSVMIEHIEWVHALNGPGAALDVIDERRKQSLKPLSFSYFEAYFYAELGDHPNARQVADRFIASLNDPSAPQAHYINAYLHFRADQLDRARNEVEKALALDPRHLIAERLRQQIESAASEQP